MEHWKPIPDTIPIAHISDRGGVRQGGKDRPINKRCGYKSVLISGRQYYIHRLVAQAFLQRSPGCGIVIHLDGDRKNCRAVNLCWVRSTPARDLATARYRKVIPDSHIPMIRQRRAAGETCASIAKDYDCHPSTVSHIVLGRRRAG
jgi:hypothetical protein